MPFVNNCIGSAPVTLLYVDDDENEAFFFQRAFAKIGAPVSWAWLDNGAKALEYLWTLKASELPKLVLLDINMPLVSGFQVLEGITASPGLAGLSVVMFSSSQHPDDKARAHALGAKGYVCKPLSLRLMEPVLRRLLEQWCPAHGADPQTPA